MKKSTTIALGVLLVFVGLVWSAGARKSDTIDEGLTICGGAYQVRRLDPNIMFGISPVIRWMSGLPAVVFGDAKLLPTPPPAPTRPMTPPSTVASPKPCALPIRTTS